MANPIVEFKGVSFKYRKEEKNLLDNLNFKVLKGEKVGIIGENGCGKSTIAKLILGIQKPDEGEVNLFGQPIHWLIHTPNLGFIGDPGYSTELLGLPSKMKVSSLLSITRKLNHSDIESTSDLETELKMNLIEDTFVGELSTGQRKRVMACLTLMRNPKVLILDEPFDGLDEEIKAILNRRILALSKESETTIILISHSLVEVDSLTQFTYRLKGGLLDKTISKVYEFCFESNKEKITKSLKMGEVFGLIHDTLKNDIDCKKLYMNLE